MPTYDYVCEKCGKEFEVFQSMKDPRLTDCPQEECDGHVRRKIGTGAGLMFKGSGFYITDYRSEGYKAAAKKESGESASPAPAAAASTKDSGGGGSGSGGGGESKSAAPAPAPASKKTE